MLSMEMLLDAQRVLDPVINHTPVVSTKDIVPDCDFYLKADCLQKTGAFKLRGAYYKIATLSDEEKAGASLPALREIMPRALPLPPGIWESRPPSASRRGRP